MSLEFFLCVSSYILIIAVATVPMGAGRVPPWYVAFYTGVIYCAIIDVPVPASVGAAVAVDP